MTAVLAVREAYKPAIKPAPPAPTTSTSNWCVFMPRLLLGPEYVNTDGDHDESQYQPHDTQNPAYPAIPEIIINHSKQTVQSMCDSKDDKRTAHELPEQAGPGIGIGDIVEGGVHQDVVVG